MTETTQKRLCVRGFAWWRTVGLLLTMLLLLLALCACSGREHVEDGDGLNNPGSTETDGQEMKTLTADQLSAFFQEARDSGVYELYYLDLATGLRRGELLGLKWTDVDLDRGVLKIQRAISRQNGKVVEAPLKTKNAYRTLPLSADAISVLKMQK